MNQIENREFASRVALILSIFGFVVPNGVFLFYFFTDFDAMTAALANPIALVFFFEAIILMAFFAWLLPMFGIDRPKRREFIVLSLFGSLCCSVPFVLYKVLKSKD